MKSIYSGLKDLNVGDDRVHYEFFGPGTNLLGERPVVGPGLPVDRSDAEPVTVTFERSGVEARWDPTKGTLLDLAESEGLSPLYSCRSGICSTCTTVLSKGEVSYVDPPLAEPEAGTALICCAYPAGQVDELVLDL